jgi:hypothetical protein
MGVDRVGHQKQNKKDAGADLASNEDRRTTFYSLFQVANGGPRYFERSMKSERRERTALYRELYPAVLRERLTVSPELDERRLRRGEAAATQSGTYFLCR